MNKPEKKKIRGYTHAGHGRGYNQACDDWEKWLREQPCIVGDGKVLFVDNIRLSEEEVRKIILWLHSKALMSISGDEQFLKKDCEIAVKQICKLQGDKE